MPQIHFNGKTYNDLAEMPAAEREAYEQLLAIFEDKDRDGTPDIFQGDVVGNIIEIVKKTSGDPEGASTLEQMPPEMRARVSKGVAKLHELGLLAQVPALSKGEQVPSWEDAEIRPSKPVIPQQSAIQEDSGARWAIPFVIMLALAICGIGALVFFLFGPSL
ncbi:MAG: hypothetical protein Kow002_02400 [Anaerolineales bacterium]